MSEVKCPKCGSLVNVNEIVEQNLKAQYNAKFLALKDKLDEKERNFNENFKKSLEAEIAKEKRNLELENIEKAKILEQSLKEKIEAENLAKNEILKKELDEKSQKIQEFTKTQIENERLKRENSEMEAKFKLESEKKINEILLTEKDKISKQFADENELKFREKDDKIAEMQKQIAELHRRIEVGSQQAQGEVQELAIEDFLRAKFPLDTITPIGKGVNGADCQQFVMSENLAKCGSILYESKRAKSWSNDWIPKFKKDMTEAKADTGILVTQVMPKDVQNVALIDGVWVCPFGEFRWFSEVVRHNLIELSYAKSANQNSETKMGMLYNYLTSSEFRLQIENIVNAFIELESNLKSEQRAMKKVWKARELSIEKARDNAVAMHMKMRSIAGAEIAEIKELDSADLENLAQIEDKSE